MNKRRSLLFAISGLCATLCGQAHAVKSFGEKKILFLSMMGKDMKFLLAKNNFYRFAAK